MDWNERRNYNVAYRRQKELSKIKKYREEVKTSQQKNMETFIEKLHSGYFDEFLEEYNPRWTHLCDISEYEAREFDKLYEKYIEEHKWKKKN